MTKWISVKDYLPEIGKKVLCFESQPQIDKEWRWEFFVAYYEEDEWHNGDIILGRCEPSHWTSLPESPE